MNPLLTVLNRSITGKPAPLIMGILNCTPDSFFSGSRLASAAAAAEAASAMERDGADILDIGGESTRPGSDYVSAEEELNRILPVIEAVRDRSGIPVSVDTRKRLVAEAALDAGANIINDISAFRDDPDLARLCAERDVPVVLMHMRETPKTMQDAPLYGDTVIEIKEELGERIDNALSSGIRRERIIIDPGFGFGKRYRDNITVLRRLKDFSALGFPLLVGLSRKSFLGRAAAGPGGPPKPPEARLYATLAANLWAALEGADILRVHDVQAAADTLSILKAVRSDRAEAE